jgi:hypothetical protein
MLPPKNIAISPRVYRFGECSDEISISVIMAFRFASLYSRRKLNRVLARVAAARPIQIASFHGRTKKRNLWNPKRERDKEL